MVQDSFSKIEPRVINTADIVEFPTMLGSKCQLLQELGLNAYQNTEEELIEVLTETAGQPGFLDICLKSSRCRRFYEVFREGGTPFGEHDPIKLVEYGGWYWVEEGKHRVCLAKRAGMERLEAFVYHMDEDTESLLAREGMPGRFRFSFSFTAGSRDPGDIHGSLAYLWVSSPPGIIPGRFDFGGAWLDVSQNTEGALINLFSGLQYRVSVDSKPARRGFFRRRERFAVESEVVILPDHSKTKIWLIEVPAAELPGFCFAGPLSFRTVYRFGCWRQGHLRQLSRMYLHLF